MRPKWVVNSLQKYKNKVIFLHYLYLCPGNGIKEDTQSRGHPVPRYLTHNIMTKSMTGYGKAVATLETGSLTVEIRTLNSKNADISIKSSLLPKDKEMEVRSLLASSLQRGTIDFYLTFEPNAAEGARQLNEPLLREYYTQAWNAASSLPGFQETGSDTRSSILLSTILRLPDVIEAKKAEIVDEQNWPLVDKAIHEAIEAVEVFRIREGAVLHEDVTSRVEKILSLYDEVEKMEGERIVAVREKLQKNLEELGTKCDPLRFEQEMIYYLEKLDINEEKVRLREHCRYFLQTIETEAPGKKLGFIIQEMGREINTTGSKANHAGIQKAVVLMKDELEKIREQSMNIL